MLNLALQSGERNRSEAAFAEENVVKCRGERFTRRNYVTRRNDDHSKHFRWAQYPPAPPVHDPRHPITAVPDERVIRVGLFPPPLKCELL